MIEKQAPRSLKCLIQRKNSKNYGKTLNAAISRLEVYLSEYQYIFRNKTKKFFDKAEKYTQGLFLANRRNIEEICEKLGAVDYFQMQHFITEAKWDERAVIDKVAQNTSGILPKRKLTGLIIDESGIPKKGDKSVGVAWQYCGNLGKLANCQVGVLACLSNGDFASMVDARLFLTGEWCNSKERCDEAGVPEDKREFKTKIELAYDIILHQIELGTNFDFIGADGFYGNDPEFASKIEDLGYLYMLDIHKDQKIFLERPEFIVPERKGTKGKFPTIARPDKKSFRVDEYYKGLKHNDWETIKVRNTTKGYLKASYHFAQVFIMNETRGTTQRRLLVICRTKTKKGFEIKYSFTNANLSQYTTKGIAYLQAQRFFIEHCIKESKQVLGMSQFQTRKWQAWQHQVALNIMTAGFILEEKLHCFEDLPLLSAWDIQEWICFCLSKSQTEEEVIDVIFSRHFKRQTDINLSYSKQCRNVSK